MSDNELIAELRLQAETRTRIEKKLLWRPYSPCNKLIETCSSGLQRTSLILDIQVMVN